MAGINSYSNLTPTQNAYTGTSNASGVSGASSSSCASNSSGASCAPAQPTNTSSVPTKATVTYTSKAPNTADATSTIWVSVTNASGASCASNSSGVSGASFSSGATGMSIDTRTQTPTVTSVIKDVVATTGGVLSKVSVNGKWFIFEKNGSPFYYKNLDDYKSGIACDANTGKEFDTEKIGNRYYLKENGYYYCCVYDYYGDNKYSPEYNGYITKSGQPAECYFLMTATPDAFSASNASNASNASSASASVTVTSPPQPTATYTPAELKRMVLEELKADPIQAILNLKEKGIEVSINTETSEATYEAINPANGDVYFRDRITFQLPVKEASWLENIEYNFDEAKYIDDIMDVAEKYALDTVGSTKSSKLSTLRKVVSLYKKYKKANKYVKIINSDTLAEFGSGVGMEILKFTYKKVGFASWHIALGCLVAKFMYEELHDSLIFLNDATNSWLNTINPASHSFDWGIGFRF